MTFKTLSQADAVQFYFVDLAHVLGITKSVGDSHGACCFLSTHFCALIVYFIGHPLLSTERVSKSRLVSQLQRRKKIDKPYSDIIKYIDLGQPKSVAPGPGCSEPDQTSRG